MKLVGCLDIWLVGWLRFEVLLLLASCFLLVKVGYPCNQVSSSLGSRVYLAETEGGDRRYIYYRTYYKYKNDVLLNLAKYRHEYLKYTVNKGTFGSSAVVVSMYSSYFYHYCAQFGLTAKINIS